MKRMVIIITLWAGLWLGALGYFEPIESQWEVTEIDSQWHDDEDFGSTFYFKMDTLSPVMGSVVFFSQENDSFAFQIIYDEITKRLKVDLGDGVTMNEASQLFIDQIRDMILMCEECE